MLKLLRLIGVTGLMGCVHRPALAVLADSTSQGGHEFESLALAALLVVVLLPALAKRRQ